MKIIVTGCNGQLGNAVIELLKNGKGSLGEIPACYDEFELFPVDVDELDISDAAAVDAFVAKTQPDLIVNCAAMTNVDGCESDVDLAEKVNADGPLNLATAAKKHNAKLVHISTDYVFRGDASTPYVEADACDPVTAYGLSKYHGEQNVIKTCEKSFILRTSWLYGLVGSNFVKTIRRVAKEKGVLKVVDDQRGNPTNAEDLAFHILLVAATENYGIYHCTGTGECSWYDFACKILEYSKIPCDISPCSTDESGRKAKRPAYSSLRNLKLEQTVGDHMREWQVALKEYINKLEKVENSL